MIADRLDLLPGFGPETLQGFLQRFCRAPSQPFPFCHRLAALILPLKGQRFP